MTTAILERIRISSDLPSMPSVALRVLELSQQDNVSLAQMAAVIQTDPALALKVLKTANSPLFGLAKKVGTIHQATAILGLRTVKVMALGFSLADALPAGIGSPFDYQRYWRRSLTGAVASKLIATELATVRADEGMVGGLLSDIGMLAAQRCAPDLYAPVLQRHAHAPEPIQNIERQLLGITHARISSDVLRQWGLPDVLCEAVAAHHGEGLDALGQRSQLLARVLYAGGSIAEVFCGVVPHADLDAIEARCLDLVPLSACALRRVLDAVHTNVQEMASLFNVPIGESVSYEQLRARAMLQLTELSISAEMDRAAATRLAETDALTRIPNRKAFDERLEAAIQEARQAGGAVGVILLDLDHFKSLNDQYGHPAGDEALRRVGRCLESVCDAPAMAARYGGEEFGVILGQATAQTLRHLAEEIRRAIERLEVQHEGHSIRFTASLGAAHLRPRDEATPAGQIIDRADQCLYQAKRRGRNRVEVAAEPAEA